LVKPTLINSDEPWLGFLQRVNRSQCGGLLVLSKLRPTIGGRMRSERGLKLQRLQQAKEEKKNQKIIHPLSGAVTK
jgi:hypothetical protein